MNAYLQQAYSLLTKTIKGVMILTLLFCSIFALFDFLLLMATHPKNHSFVKFPFFLAYVFIPIFVLVILDGVLVGTFLAWLRKKLSGFVAILLGLVIGSTLAFAINYMVWLNSSPTERMLFYPTFLAFMLYSFTNFFGSVFFVNIFFLPTIFSILVSTYMGWRINNLYNQQTIQALKE